MKTENNRFFNLMKNLVLKGIYFEILDSKGSIYRLEEDHFHINNHSMIGRRFLLTHKDDRPMELIIDDVIKIDEWHTIKPIMRVDEATKVFNLLSEFLNKHIK
jgi:hypothetical protein